MSMKKYSVRVMRESTAELYARLSEEERAELSEEDRTVHRHIAAEDRRIEFGAKVLSVVLFMLLALGQLYFGGGGGYGRYSADAYDWMETQ
jgi:hypothetical protein